MCDARPISDRLNSPENGALAFAGSTTGDPPVPQLCPFFMPAFVGGFYGPFASFPLVLFEKLHDTAHEFCMAFTHGWSSLLTI